MGKLKKKKQWNRSSTDLNYKIIGNSSGHSSNTRWSRGPCQEEKQQNWSLNEKEKTSFLCIYFQLTHTYVACAHTQMLFAQECACPEINAKCLPLLMMTFLGSL